jgi:DNA-binding NarL/FixJ family response regulator
MKRLLIMADHSLIVHAIRLALRQTAGFDVVGFVDGRDSAVALLQQVRPDVVLLDDMQNSDHALARLREISEFTPAAEALLLTMEMDDEWLDDAFAAGASAVVSKSVHPVALGTLIREIVDRNIVCALPPALADGSLTGENSDLTAREREILALVADGLTNATIGKELWVTEQTVKFHLSNIYRKLEVSNRTEASRYAHMNGMLRRQKPRLIQAPKPPAGDADVRELRPVHAGVA